jgi:hypothetical protein
MKKQLLIMMLSLLLFQAGVEGQLRKQAQHSKEPLITELQANLSETGRYVFVQNQLLLTNLNEEEFDRIAIINMQGSVVQKQTVSGPAVKLNLTDLEEGVHLLLLHSSSRMKEKSIKMIVKR